jgi:hypothetical protein
MNLLLILLYFVFFHFKGFDCKYVGRIRLGQNRDHWLML